MTAKGRGQLIVGLAAVALVIAASANATLLMLAGAAGPFLALLRLGIAIALAWFMFRGGSTARRVNVALSAVGGLYALIDCLSMANHGRWAAAPVLAIAACFYFAVGATLAFSPAVGEYFRNPLLGGVLRAGEEER